MKRTNFFIQAIIEIFPYKALLTLPCKKTLVILPHKNPLTICYTSLVGPLTEMVEKGDQAETKWR
ncbi:hypothetical protein EAI_00466 [Harpegnathos saltator]|uniref:Uncharacterized protein n=1 Tax=Harpegnathos saltator TaxID=610380 RepID=E2BMG3_HARSA|nr:hypothetical protein EAI_00466 [Harpegnathos saltator]